MLDKVLLLVEGEKTEVSFLRRLIKVCSPGLTVEIVPMSINIYIFYKQLKAYETNFTTTLDVLKRIKADQKDDLEKLNDNYAFIYLIFDFDIQEDSINSKQKMSILEDMIDIFSDEADDFGKLLIDYPMVESFRDYPSSDPNVFLSKERNVSNLLLCSYKEMVHTRGNTLDVNKYSSKQFEMICKLNIRKAFEIIQESVQYEKFISPDFLKMVFKSEQTSYLAENGCVVPLCELTFFLVFLYGLEFFNHVLKDQNI